MAEKTVTRFRSSEYIAWYNMHQRCYNSNRPDWKNYGGRGIIVCPEWHRFRAFEGDMGPRPSPEHSLERTDVNGMYGPDICVWATKTVQSRNRRDTIYLTHPDGITLPLATWAEEIGVGYFTLMQRYKRGYAPEKLFDSGIMRPQHCEKLVYQGKEYTVAELADLVGMDVRKLWQRAVRYSMPIEKAIDDSRDHRKSR